jgi:dolichyl-phosphate-mannose--protein O-mannosyl transferase
MVAGLVAMAALCGAWFAGAPPIPCACSWESAFWPSYSVALVPRSMFIYHYFASVPFIILAIVYFIKDRHMDRPVFRKKLWIYLGIVLLLFACSIPSCRLTHPVLAGRLMR